MQVEKVGIVIPIYNVKKYLKECLESVINQTYKNLEIVLVDDGSTNSSLKIAKEYELKDNRITIITKENGGLSSARNAGIEYFNKNVESQIDYLIFLDSDDYLALNCMEVCVKKMRGVEIVWFNLEPVVESGKGGFVGEMDVYGYTQERILSREEWVEDTKRLQYFWWAWQGMIDFKFLQKIGLKFIDAMHEDHHFGTLLFWQASKIYILPERFYKYRIRSDSIINVNTKSGVAESSHLYPLFLAFDKDKAAMSKYNKYASLFINFLEMEKFSQNLSDKDEFEKMFFPWLLNEARELFLINKDPWNLKLELREALEKYQQILLLKQLGAGKRIKGQLAYKLGEAIIKAKSPLRILTLPWTLFRIRQKHALEQRILKVIYTANPQLKPPPLECYDDYKKALQYKKHLSYRLGETLLKNPLGFPFRIPLIYKNYKKVES